MPLRVIFGSGQKKFFLKPKWPCPACELSTHVPVYILQHEVRRGHRAQLDRVAEGRPCPSPLCRSRMVSSHWQLPRHARGQLGKSGRSHTLLCQSRQERLVALPVLHIQPRTGSGWRGGYKGGRGGAGTERERGWIASLFFNLVFNLPLSTFYQSQVPLVHGHWVRWTPSTIL